MPAADYIDVVGNLIGIDVEMSRGAGSAERTERAGNGSVRKLGTALYMSIPSAVQLIGIVVGPRSSRAVEGSVKRI